MNLNQHGTEVLRALFMAFAMFWEILWPLIVGFTLSGAVQAVVSKREMSRLLLDDSPRSLAVHACLAQHHRHAHVRPLP